MILVSSGLQPFKAESSRFNEKPEKTPYLKVSEEKFTVTIQKYPSLLSGLIKITVNCPCSQESAIRRVRSDAIFSKRDIRMGVNVTFCMVSSAEFKEMGEKIAKLFQYAQAGVFFQDKAAAFMNGCSFKLKGVVILPGLIVNANKRPFFPDRADMKLIMRIREYEMTKERNAIILKIMDRSYRQCAEPKEALRLDLKEAGCTPLAELFSEESE